MLFFRNTGVAFLRMVFSNCSLEISALNKKSKPAAKTRPKNYYVMINWTSHSDTQKNIPFPWHTYLGQSMELLFLLKIATAREHNRLRFLATGLPDLNIQKARDNGAHSGRIFSHAIFLATLSRIRLEKMRRTGFAKGRWRQNWYSRRCEAPEDCLAMMGIDGPCTNEFREGI